MSIYFIYKIFIWNGSQNHIWSKNFDIMQKVSHLSEILSCTSDGKHTENIRTEPSEHAAPNRPSRLSLWLGTFISGVS